MRFRGFQSGASFELSLSSFSTFLFTWRYYSLVKFPVFCSDTFHKCSCIFGFTPSSGFSLPIFPILSSVSTITPKVNVARLNTRKIGWPGSPSKSHATKFLVQLVDLLNAMNQRFENLGKRMTCAITQLTSSEAAIAKLALLSQIIEASLNPFLNELVGASRCIGSVPSE